MDEGFTSYISSAAMNEIMDQKKELPNASAYNGYFYLVKSGNREPLTTLLIDMNTITHIVYLPIVREVSFLSQLGYIIGKENLTRPS